MKIQITFQEKVAEFPVSFEDGSSFDVGFEEGIPLARASPYSGSYEVIPRINPQNLPTGDKHLAKDILVYAIPYHEVENTERGKTAIIGGI